MIRRIWGSALSALLVSSIALANSPSPAVPAAGSGASSWAKTSKIPTEVRQETAPVRQLDPYLNGFHVKRSRSAVQGEARSDPAPEPYANIPTPDTPLAVQPVPSEPGLPPPPMPQPAEPGLAPPPMPQPAEPPPLSMHPKSDAPAPAVPEQEPAPPMPGPEPAGYEYTNNK
jgi:hypothetical protein